MISGLTQLAQEFAGHADKGTYDQVPHDKAYGAYQQLAQQLGPEQLAQAAREYYERATPAQRSEIARAFQQAFGHGGGSQAQQDPNQVSPQQLAQLHTQAQQQQPDLIQQIFSPGGALGGTASKVAVAGIAALAAKHFLNQ